MQPQLAFEFDDKPTPPPIPKDLTKLVCLDIECTGFDKEKDQIIEVAAVIFDTEKTYEEFHTLIYTDKEIPIIVQDLTGIKNSMLEGQPTLESQAQAILDFCQDYPIVGHNINFDLDFLDAKGIKVPGRRIDTHPMSEIFMPDAISHSLEILCHHYVNHQPTHRALDDVIANIQLFQYMHKLWLERRTEFSAQILQKSDVPWQRFFLGSTATPQATAEINQLPKPITAELENDISTIQPEIIVATPQTVKILNSHPDYEELPPYYKIISRNKLEQLLNKDSLTENEGTLALKITLSGRYQDPNLVITTDHFKVGRNERKLIDQLTENSIIIPEYIENSTGSIVIEHSYFFKLLNELNNDQRINLLLQKNILFIDEPFLEETYIRSQTETIHYNRFPAEQADMAFGLLGIFWNNHQENEKAYELILDQQNTSGSSWEKVVSTFTNIDVTLPTLATHYIWLKSQKNNPPYIQYISRNVNYNLNELSSKLPQFTTKQYQNHQKITVKVDQNLPKPTDPSYNQELLSVLDNYINQYDHDICIVTTSHQQIKDMYKHCLAHHQDRNCIAQGLSGSAGKLQHKISEYDDHNILFCTYPFYLKHKPQFDHLSLLLMVKLPMSSPHHPFYQIKKSENRNFFMESVLPHSAHNLLETIQTPEPTPEIVLLDSRIQTENYGKKMAEMLTETIQFV